MGDEALKSLIFTAEEQAVVNRVNHYFLSGDMSIYEKLSHAKLIAEHELEAHNFANESEKHRIAHYKNILDQLLWKLNQHNKRTI